LTFGSYNINKMATKCVAVTKKGTQCMNNANNGEFCGIHIRMDIRMNDSKCEYIDDKMNKCFKKKCNIGSFCYLHSEENQCAICYEPMLMCRKFMKCSHFLCNTCFSESIINKPNCPMCREPVEDFEVKDSIHYLVKNKLYSIVISQTFHSINIPHDQMVIFKTYFELKYSGNRIFNTSGMTEALKYIKENEEMYRIFSGMVRTSRETLNKNIDKDENMTDKYQYVFNIV